jgi:hypothetical protein
VPVADPEPGEELAITLRELRRRADEDYISPPKVHEAGRHQVDLPAVGVRVTLTRARYPNRPDGADQYAVTISRSNLAGPPADEQVLAVLGGAFGELAGTAVARASGSAVRMFRVPAPG